MDIPTKDLPQHINYSFLTPEAKAYAQHCAWLYNCPIDYVLAAMLMTTAATLGKKVKVQCAGYTNYPNLFLAIVGRSGINKSTPLRNVMAPLYQLDRQLHDEYKRERDFTLERIKYINKHNKKCDEIERLPLPPMPQEKALLISDATPEKRNDILHAIDPTNLSLTVYFDELPALFKQFGRYNDSSEIEDLLTMFDGSYYKVSRKSQETLIIEHPCLSILGTIQDNILADTFAQRSMLKNGFNPRWLFVYPPPTEVPHDEPKQPNPTLRQWWFDFIQRDVYQGTPESILSVDADAQQFYYDWKNALIDQQNLLDTSTDEGAYQCAILSKLHILCLRWLIPFHYLSTFRANPSVCYDEMFAATVNMSYFLRTAMKVFDKLMPAEKEDLTRGYRLFRQWQEAELQGYTQTQFAEEQGVSQQYISKLIKLYSKNERFIN